MSLRRHLRAIAIVMLVAIAGCGSPPDARGTATADAKSVPAQSHPFRGRVEAVDKAAGSVMVAGDNVEGWMGAMTMPYAIAPPEVLEKLAAGDQITATVYDGDFKTLHEVSIVPPASSK
jgi:protein SCO1/2